MEFQTISTYPSTLNSEYHHFLSNNEKIWAFSRKYVAQPTYNWGHRVSFTGGYTTFFDTKSAEWDPKGNVEFKEQASEENLEEFLFTFNSQIFMLLYSHFGGIQFLTLLKFDEDKRDFERFAHVESDQKSQRVSQNGATSKHSAVVVDGETTEGKFLITYVDQIIQIHRLQIDIPSQQAYMEYIGELSNDVLSSPLQPTSGVVIDNNVFVQGAVHGCGMMWQPGRVFKLNIGSGEVNYFEVTGDQPHFGFIGSRYTALNPKTNNWLHATGSTRHGMTESVFNGEVWEIVGLSSGNPKWLKSDLNAPDPETDDPLISTDSDNLYVGSKKIGVAKAKLNF